MKRVITTVLLAAVVFAAIPARSAMRGDVCRDSCLLANGFNALECSRVCSTDESIALPSGIDFLVRRLRGDTGRIHVFSPMTSDDAEWRLEAIRSGDSGRKDPLPEVVSFMLDGNIADPANAVASGSVVTLQPGAAAAPESVVLGFRDGGVYAELPVSHEARLCEKNGRKCKTENLSVIFNSDSFSTGQDGAPEGLLLKSVTAGRDTSHTVISMRLAGNIDPGRALPMRHNFYLLSFFDPSRAMSGDFYRASFFLMYSPHHYNRGGGCRMILRRGADWELLPSPVTCSVRDDELVFAVDSGVAFGRSDLTAFFAVTGTMFSDESSVLSSYSPVAVLRFSE